jgi:hypothetical protein
MGEPGSEAFSCDQQLVKKDQEKEKIRPLHRDFFSLREIFKSL